VHPNLSFEQAPPIGVPLRFLLTAPWFGVAAGLVLAWSGEPAVLSRWTPQALSVVHLLVVGYLLQGMIGALFQFVPVAAGGNVWRPRLVAGIVHPALVLAAIILAIGLFRFDGTLLRLAAGLFASGVVFQAVVVGTALMRTPARGPTIAALRLAVLGLLVTVVLGISLAEGLAGNHVWPLAAITNVHAAWGLGGWVLMLVMGVSYFVVPMFQLTPQYPATFSRWAPISLLVVLLLWSLQLSDFSFAMLDAIWLAGLIVTGSYAVVTLKLQARRRRHVADPTFLFFRGAMISLLAACAVGVAAHLVEAPILAWWLGVLVIVGAFVSLINGMAYKIVPFLCWLHLQRLAGIGGTVPNMREMLSEPAQAMQLRLHFLAVVLLVIAGLVPQVAVVGGLVFALSSGWLGWNLAGAVRRYRTFKGRVTAGVADRES
jgi:hypothetical protein